MNNIIIWLIIIVLIINSIYIWILNKRIKNVTKYLLNKIHDISVDNQVSEIISNDTNEHKDITVLGDELFKKIKKTYRLKSTTFNDITKELKQSTNIEKDLKEAIIEFFNEMVIISYKDEILDDSHKEMLKSKLILNKLNNELDFMN